MDNGDLKSRVAAWESALGPDEARAATDLGARPSAQGRPGALSLTAGLALLAFVAFAPSLAPHGFELALGCAGVFILPPLVARVLALARIPRTRRARREAPAAGLAEWPNYTVIAPVFREVAGVDGLVAAMADLDYPADRLEVLFVGEAGDEATLSAVRAAVAAHGHMALLTTPAGAPKTKGRASNYALAAARGAHVVIFDAEDRPEPDQLKKAAAAFAHAPADVVCLQARLVIDNGAESLLARMMESEYAAQFDGFLPVLRDWAAPIPLSGSSNHFRTAALRALGGWDAWNVTEDADLGLRIARGGGRARLLDAATYEEAPASVANWRTQRARWIKGFMQTAAVHTRSGPALWRGAPRGVLTLACAIVGGFAAPLLFWPLTLGSVTAALWSRAPSAPALGFAVGLSGLGLLTAMASAAAGLRRARFRDRSALALFAPFYWILLTLAALDALRDAVVRPHHWRRTAHGSRRRASAETGEECVHAD